MKQSAKVPNLAWWMLAVVAGNVAVAAGTAAAPEIRADMYGESISGSLQPIGKVSPFRERSEIKTKAVEPVKLVPIVKQVDVEAWLSEMPARTVTLQN